MGNHWTEQPLPAREVERIGPFLLVHHWQRGLPGGQNHLEVGVGPHPYRGFSPVTCIYAGAVPHRDSRGNDHVVRAGGTQWMDCGAGIVHSERPEVRLAEEGCWDIALVQGEWNGHASPIPAAHPLRIANFQGEAGAQCTLPMPRDGVGSAYVLDGRSALNGQVVEGKKMLVLDGASTDDALRLRCDEPARVLFLSGAP